MSQSFSKPYEPLGGDINVKLTCLCKSTKADIKNISFADISIFALKSNKLKTKIGKRQSRYW